jgi:amino acid transporter
VPSSGALAQIPLLTHGRAAGFIGGWSAWLGYVALPAIEVLATVQYLGSRLPWLTSGNGQELSSWGIGLAVLLLLLFGWINLAGVTALARWIDGLTVWKLLVPLAVSLALLVGAAHWPNLAVQGAQPGGLLEALSTGGILFSLMGFRTAMDLGGEARNPQRDVPLAMGLGLAISLAIYLVLQLAFLVAVPPADLGGGWKGLELAAQGGPLVAVALGLGLGWLATLLITDAVVSPSATALAYMGTAARVNWMLARCGLLPAAFGHINAAGVPSVALGATLLVGIALLQGGPSWGKVVGFVTAALVISLAMGPVSLEALRRQAPQAERPYRLPLASVLCPLAFVVASWAIVWCGWSSLRLAVPLVLVPGLAFALLRHRESNQLAGGAWWFPYLAGLALIAWTRDASAPLALGPGPQLLVSGLFALAIFPLAVRCRLAQASPLSLHEPS